MSDVVERAKTALEDTTPGPWEADLDPHGETRGIWPTGPGEEIVIGNYVRADGFESVDWAGGSDEDLRFIAQARTLVPELVAEVGRLRRVVDALKVVIEHVDDKDMVPTAYILSAQTALAEVQP